MRNSATEKITTCPQALDEETKRRLLNDGYVAFANVLTSEELETVRNVLRRICHEMSSDPASMYSPPLLHSPGGNQSGAVFRRSDSRSSIHLEPGHNPEGRSAEEIELSVRKYMWFYDEDPVFARILAPGGKIHSVVEAVLGKYPVLFQEMALVKPAFVGSSKPWHQDNAYFSISPLESILGVWIALDDAEIDNGCMHVIPGGHKIGAFRHHHGSDCEIDIALLETSNVRPVPVPAGGAMFFYGMLPHQTPKNSSPKRRRALQFHYRAADTVILDPAEYDRVFVDRTGSPASCRAASRLGF